MVSAWTQPTHAAFHPDRFSIGFESRFVGRPLVRGGLRRLGARIGWLGLLAICACVSLFGIDRDRRIDQLYHTSWTAKEGAPGSVTSLAQTTDGYLWIGTASGLVRFDGIRFEPFVPPTGQALPATHVLSLMAVPDGGLWIGFSSGDASFLKSGRLTNYGEQDGLPHGSLMAFASGENGTIWAAEDAGGLFRLKGSRWQRIGIERKFTGDASTVFVDRRGTVWVGSMEKLFYLPRGEDRFHLAGENLRHVLGLAESPNGALWMAEVARAVRPVALSPRDQMTPQPEIQVGSRAILFDHAGSLWITSLGDGLRRVPFPEKLNGLKISELSDAAEMFAQKQGLSGDHVRCILEDREGNVWIGTSMGIDRFRQSALVPVPFPPGAAGFELIAGDRGAIHVAISNRKQMKVENGRLLEEPAQPLLLSSFRVPGGFVMSKSYLSELVGESKRLSAMNIVQGPQYHPSVLVWDSIFAFPEQYSPDVRGILNASKNGFQISLDPLVKDGRGRPWASVPLKGVFRGEDHGWKSLESLGGPSDAAISESADTSGQIWFGFTSDRAVSLSGDSIQTFSSKDGVSVGDVQVIVSGNSDVWIGGDRGLELLAGHRFVPVTLGDGKALSRVSGIVVTPHDGLWIAEDRGVIHIPNSEVLKIHQNPTTRISYRLFDLSDGLSALPQGYQPKPSAIQGLDGVLWFATTLGVAWLDPNRIPVNTLPPPVSIVSAASSDRSYGHPSDLKFPSLTTSLRITYTALSLSVPERIQFKYKLEGIDKQWVDAGGRREVFYTNLRPGSYRFTVIACNSDGFWNETGASLDFFITPKYYETLWFKTLYIILGVLGLWLFYLYRLNRKTVQIQERLGARLEERERIARELHDTLLQGFQGLMLRFQAVLKNLPDHEPARQMIEKALDRADEVLLEGRQRVRELRDEGSTGNELSDELSQCGKEMGQDHSALFTVAVIGTPQALDLTVRNETYRIAREALTNAFRHSEASKIEIEITYDYGSLQIVIRDDGIGIAQEVLSGGRTGHWGLSGMRERAQQIGARLSVWSRPGAGTEVDLNIPSKLAYLRDHKKLRQRWIHGVFKR